jgi:AAA+ ATPase superfamily predicted ATPase
VLEKRTPVTEFRQEAKIGRYYIEDPALRFWFRYIFKNQSLIEIRDEKGLTAKIADDLPNFMGSSFEKLIRDILVRRNRGDILPFRFSRIGNFWTKKGETEIDIVAIDEEGESILFGECTLKGKRFTVTEALRLREKAGYVR